MVELWHQVHDRLRAFIAKRVGDQPAADDILQEVFLRVHRGIGDVKDPDRVMSWLYQIARNVIIDYYRAPERRLEVPAGSTIDLEGAASPSSGAPEESNEAGLAACLSPMLDRLSQEYREAVTLVELDGLTHQAAAERLGISLSGMKSRVQRGRKQLKHMLNECCLIQLDRRGGVVTYETRDAGCDPCNRART